MALKDNKFELLTDCQCISCISYYKNLIKYKKLWFERFEHYQKVSYRNRYYLAGPNGRIILSIPLLKGKNQRTLMKDVRIDNMQKWQSLHWKTLTSAYRRSPWFEYYEEELRPYFFETKYEFLMDWNTELFDLLNRFLGLEIETGFTEEYRPSYSDNSRIIDMRNVFLPPPGPDPAHQPRYQQVFEDRTGFLPNLSILDLLFCEGKNTLSLLALQG